MALPIGPARPLKFLSYPYNMVKFTRFELDNSWLVQSIKKMPSTSTHVPRGSVFEPTAKRA